MNHSIEKAKRIMWRLEAYQKQAMTERPPRKRIKRPELVKAIMIEAGFAIQTYYTYKDALIKLGWLRKHKKRFIITGLHQTEDFE